jgi:hypothetical protein
MAIAVMAGLRGGPTGTQLTEAACVAGGRKGTSLGVLKVWALGNAARAGIGVTVGVGVGGGPI